MKKYKTFGELLAFIKANRQACNDENLSFRIQRTDTYENELFPDARSLLTRVYPIEVFNSTVLGIKIITYSNSSRILIKLYVH